MVNPLLVDMVAFIAYLGLGVGYHVFYGMLMRHHPEWSMRSRMHEHRLNWIETVQKRGERIMAVQALRNLIMTNTFLASTMILLVAFIANYIVFSNPPQALSHPDPSILVGAVPVAFKGALLMLLYAFAFVMFLTSLRNLSHLTILIGVEPEQLRATEGRDPRLFMAERLNQVEAMSTYGRRAVYFSLPVFAWLFSPWLFAATSFVIWLFFVYVTDFVHPFQRRKSAQEPGGLLGQGAPK